MASSCPGIERENRTRRRAESRRALRQMPRVALDRFGSAPARLPEDADVAWIHHGTGSLDFREERRVQLLEVVPRHARVDVVADVVVDVVPEEAVYPVADDGSR